MGRLRRDRCSNDAVHVDQVRFREHTAQLNQRRLRSGTQPASQIAIVNHCHTAQVFEKATPLSALKRKHFQIDLALCLAKYPQNA